MASGSGSPGPGSNSPGGQLDVNTISTVVAGVLSSLQSSSTNTSRITTQSSWAQSSRYTCIFEVVEFHSFYHCYVLFGYCASVIWLYVCV